MKTKRWVPVRVAASLLVLMLVAVTAQAKTFFKPDIEGGKGAAKFAGEAVQTDRGNGWSSRTREDGLKRFDVIEYTIVPGTDIPLDAGSINISLRRERSVGPRWGAHNTTWETLFSFLGNEDERLFTGYIQWESEGNAAVSGVAFDTPNPKLAGRLWGMFVPFDRKIAVGEWVDLTFIWGPGGNRILVDGKEVQAYYRKYDGAKGIPFDTGARDATFAEHIAKAKTLLIGSDLGWNSENQSRVGIEALVNSTLGSFVIRDAAGAETAPVIGSVIHDAQSVKGFSGKLVGGDSVTVTMQGTAGAGASFDIASLPNERNEIALDWKGWGVYLEEKSFFDRGEVNLRDVEEYRVYLSKEPFAAISAEGLNDIVVGPGTALLEADGITYRIEGEPLAVIDDLRVQSYLVENLESGVPYYVAVAALMDDRSLRPIVMSKIGLPMTESTDVAGTYTGSYQVGYADRNPEAVVVGRLALAGLESRQAAEEILELDTALRIVVTTSPSELKADEKSTSKVTAKVTDANGDDVSGHKVRFLLATTSQYTGVVGGGQFTAQYGGTLDEGFEAETDLFGQAIVSYTAGFAAKTAVIVARDMLSNDTGAGYVKTYIQATAELQLEPTQPVAAAEMGYVIEVTSSDEWLTADGESEARITARVTLENEPVEGHKVSFAVSSGSGSIRVQEGTTGKDGKAHAVYTAGKKIGIVLITATDTTIGLSGSVQIELRSDAPAKIKIRITPETLPADGSSAADLLVLVTDINDNPNEGIGMEFNILTGGGRINRDDEVTDRNGEANATYVAGRSPGKVTIEVTVRSTVPTAEELAGARNLAVSVTDSDVF